MGRGWPLPHPWCLWPYVEYDYGHAWVQPPRGVLHKPKVHNVGILLHVTSAASYE